MMCQPPNNIEIPSWANAFGSPEFSGKIKTVPDDFIVNENLSFKPEGEGEHVFLRIEKCGENTEFVARLLARFSGVRQRDVSYAGLKDRHARTQQWFSVWMPGKKELDWKRIETETIKIVEVIRHLRKLKRGVLSSNDFQLIIRDCKGNIEKLDKRLQQIKTFGMPNYFGSQRFGRQGHNINKALALFEGEKVKREQRSIYLSAVRSYLFNTLLSKRIEAGNWNQAINGDVLIFDQSNSFFKMGQLDEELIKRVGLGEIHPTGMMFGKGELQTQADALALERFIIERNPLLTAGLTKFDLSDGRRALRVGVKSLQWEVLEDSMLMLRFSLPSGCYATSLLKEVIKLSTQAKLI